MLSSNFFWLVVVLVIAVSVPIIIKLYADWDYRRQLEGKQKERTFEGESSLHEAEELIPTADALQEQMKRDAAIGEMRMRSQQNAMSAGMLHK